MLTYQEIGSKGCEGGMFTVGRLHSHALHGPLGDGGGVGADGHVEPALGTQLQAKDGDLVGGA